MEGVPKKIPLFSGEQSTIDRLRELSGEKCGVFAYFSPNKDANVAATLAESLSYLQHRGQQGAGVAVHDGDVVTERTGKGLVSHVFSKPSDVDHLVGNIGIGHTQYSTNRESKPQPVVFSDVNLAIAHNGNFPVVEKLEAVLKGLGVTPSGHSDSEMIGEIIAAYMRQGQQFTDAVKHAYQDIRMKGTFSLVAAAEGKIVALRDPSGIRPLSMAQTRDGDIAVASETAAFWPSQAQYVRDIAAGEMLVLSKEGTQSTQLEKEAPQALLDVFELIYFARPDSSFFGVSVSRIRKELGREMEQEFNLAEQEGILTWVPQTSMPTVLGAREVSHLPLEEAIIKNAPGLRTFIDPDQSSDEGMEHMNGTRKEKVRRKLSVVPDLVQGEVVHVFDDSVVRSTTAKIICGMLRDAGVQKIHFYSASPKVKSPDFYGVDTPNPEELAAAMFSSKEIAEKIGADSMNYLSIEGMFRAFERLGIKKEWLCTACLNAQYPIDIGEENRARIIKAQRMRSEREAALRVPLETK